MKLSIKKTFEILVRIAIFSLFFLGVITVFFNELIIKNQRNLTAVHNISASREMMNKALLNFFIRQENMLTASSLQEIERLPKTRFYGLTFNYGLEQLSKTDNQDKTLKEVLLSLNLLNRQFISFDNQLYSTVKKILIDKKNLEALVNTVNDELHEIRDISDSVRGMLLLKKKEEERLYITTFRKVNLLTKQDQNDFKLLTADFLATIQLNTQSLSEKLTLEFVELSEISLALAGESNSDTLRSIKDNKLAQLSNDLRRSIKQLSYLTESVPEIHQATSELRIKLENILSNITNAHPNIFDLQISLNTQEALLKKLIHQIQLTQRNMLKQFIQLSIISDTMRETLLNKSKKIQLYNSFLSIMVIISMISVMAILGYRLRTKLGKSIDTLVYAMHDISVSEGKNLQVPLETTPYDELNQVCTAFNMMTNRLQFSYDHLQELVDQKTHLLSESQNNLMIRHAITSLLVEHLPFNEAMYHIIKTLCEITHCEAGLFWQFDQMNKVLTCMSFFGIQDEAILHFCEMSKQLTFASGEGIPGHVYENKTVQWLDDIQEDKNFIRSQIAFEAGLHTSFAFPIMYRAGSVGTVEFFMREKKPVDSSLLETLQDVSGQITIFLEREESQKQFEDLSRKAGRSEVASSVQHNIGNILNSVNVSVGILREKCADTSLIKGFSKTIELINKHVSDIPYFVDDPQGKLIPTYLAKLTDSLMEKHTDTKKELTELFANLKKIQDIVATHSDLSGTSNINEKIFLPEIINVSLNIFSQILEDKHINVKKIMPENAWIISDKSKLSQILSNLIENSQNALSAQDLPVIEKRLIIDVDFSPTSWVVITVTDNGIGIAPENIINIFSLTTKMHRLGFGLHSCSNMAKELGGSLHAKSDGLGKGASFILKLPKTPHLQQSS